MNKLTLVTYSDNKGEFRFHFKRNGKILMSGESYKRRGSMEKMLTRFLRSIELNEIKFVEK